jgi:hypothetical protein
MARGLLLAHDTHSIYAVSYITSAVNEVARANRTSRWLNLRYGFDMSEPWVRGVVKDAFKYVLALSGIVGLYLAASQLKAEALFWWVVVGALALAIGRLLLTKAVDAIRRWQDLIRKGREHGNLLRVAGAWQTKAVELEQSLAEIEQNAETIATANVLEGRRRLLGELLARKTNAVIAPKSVGLVDDEFQIAAHASGSAPPIVGSQWRLKVSGLNQTKAILTVVKSETPWVNFAIDRVEDEGYMKNLIRDSTQNSTLPESLIIERREIIEINDLLSEG